MTLGAEMYRHDPIGELSKHPVELKKAENLLSSSINKFMDLPEGFSPKEKAQFSATCVLLSDYEVAAAILVNAPADQVRMIAERGSGHPATALLVEHYCRNYKGGRPASRRIDFVSVQITALIYEVCKRLRMEGETAEDVRDELAACAPYSKRTLESILTRAKKINADEIDLENIFLEIYGSQTS